jgi:hypothetical protein
MLEDLRSSCTESVEYTASNEQSNVSYSELNFVKLDLENDQSRGV